MESQDGEMLAYANSLWTFIDVKTGRPVNVGEEQIKAYELEERLDMNYASRKLPMPKGGETGDPFAVQKHHLDTNHHVNNGQYIQMAREYVPEDFRIRQMRAEYKQQARLNDVIIPQKSVGQDKITVLLNNEKSEAYAVRYPFRNSTTA